MKNQVVWVDIPVVDLNRSIAFYSAVLGETVEKQKFEETEFGILPHAQSNVGGCLYVSKDVNKPSTTGPLIYLNVEGRMDKALQEVGSRGGKVLQGKHSIGPHGFRALIEDSEGNRLALHSPTA